MLHHSIQQGRVKRDGEIQSELAIMMNIQISTFERLESTKSYLVYV